MTQDTQRTLEQILEHVRCVAKTGLRLRAVIDLSGNDKEAELIYTWGERKDGLTPNQINKIAQATELRHDKQFKQVSA